MKKKNIRFDFGFGLVNSFSLEFFIEFFLDLEKLGNKNICRVDIFV